MEGKTWKETSYSKRFVEIDHEEVESDKKKQLGVFAHWFDVNTADRSLKIRKLSKKDCQGYTHLKNYVLTIPSPPNENGKFVIPETVYNNLKEHI